MHRAFVPKKNTKSVGMPILQLLGLRSTKGDIGLELEFEGNKFKREELPAAWSYHKDGSLRGEDNAEYVLKKPILFRDVAGAVGAIFDDMAKYGTVLTESNRTSVHVHLNCQTFYLNRLTSFIAIYTILEELLTEWCGDHRVGNLFCMRGIDAPGTLTYLQRFVERDGNYNLPDNLHYAAMNPQALFKFGSLEFRTLRGANDPKLVLDWVGILERLYTLSDSFPDPREICSRLSAVGPLSFFDELLGEYAPIVRAGVSMDDDEVRECVYRGVRLVQSLCYCRDWSQFEGLTIAPDPFSRDSKKISRKIQQYAQAEFGGQASPPLPAAYSQQMSTFQTLQFLSATSQEEELDFD